MTYREVCDTCGTVIPRVRGNPIITVDKLVMPRYKSECTLHFCDKKCFLMFMESRV